MAQTDPVYITFEFRGDIDKEVNKVTLGIKGLRDEAATTYKKLIADSSAAYNAMSAESRKLATTMQENISSLRSLSAMQEQLDRELEAGTIRQPSRPDSRPRRSGNSCSAGSSAGRRPSSSVSHC